MWQSIYTIFTTYEGVYVFYLIPIIYFIMIVFSVISSRHREHKRIGVKDVTVVVAILLILLDFVNYLYLFFTKTGKLLPPLYLLIKYLVGCLLWVWIFWYSYIGHFSRHVAGEYFRTRYTKLLWIFVGSLLLAFVGIRMS